MIRELVAATGNLGKLQEFREVLAPHGFSVVAAADAGWTGEVEETGATLRENAELKARAVADATDRPALADDSGLFVAALDGAPGVHSARYAGPEQDAQANLERLLLDLAGVGAEQRGAEFRCVIALAEPGGPVAFFEGTCSGRIIEEPRGTGGFGYDPVFEVEDTGLAFAELSPTDKNRRSHRGRALARLVRYMES